MKESDNLTGECLLKTLGAGQNSPPGEAAKGILVIKKVLRAIDIKENTYELADGSGLSTYNLLSPDLVVKLLQVIAKDFSLFPEFFDALAIAGVDGTLKNRFKESPLTRYFRAKTGAMSGVSCISGYLQTRQGNLLAISLMMNGFTGSAQPLKTAQDEILKILWEQY